MFPLPRHRSTDIPGAFADPLRGVQEQFRGVLQLQLFLDAVAKGIDGGHRQFQILGDLAGGLPLAQQPEHFQFAVA